MTNKNKPDGRSRQARIKKWIKDQRAFGKKHNLGKGLIEQNIRMRLKGYDNIAGLDKKGLNAMKYKNSVKMKIIKTRGSDYYVVWRKKK